MTVISREHIARKTYTCGRCGEHIQPGECYVRHALTPRDSDIGNDHWQVERRHLADDYRCLAASGEL